MDSLTLPRFINANGLYSLLELLSIHRASPCLSVNISELQRVSPAGLSTLCAWYHWREKNGLSTHFAGKDACTIHSYLERMNLWRLCQPSPPETASELNGRFIPLTQISHQTGKLGEQFAECLAPGGEDYEHPMAGLYDASYYLITELANNVRQHSRGRGFVSAQTTNLDGYVRIAFTDAGMGIRGSLREAGFDWAQEGDDTSCILQALTSRVSSKGQPSNEGVGLTLSTKVASLMGGWTMIASGTGIVTISPEGAVNSSRTLPGLGFPGTLITIAFKKTLAAEFDDKLLEAKDMEGLLPPGGFSANFT
ncbi:hypothetical protein SAMN02745181_3225 [Rubritalea squalenifaciens DSM 18772]|uniref:Histidine kinase/HSP90-like ATPase domain-containing protein n=1 Tax=Rubritalea squalenifaciens DSM 18772 TaxID=1123071 RepID=A0A1M6PLA6_9BACT|nr:ATP-binding protein [Rubritalea squalenifaciens]SHK08701.1 hypothetical protein SAMN02745181_3225 [Rubritalea squalenifaciens DSM 18772]